MAGGQPRVRVYAPSGRIPVWVGGSKETGGRDREGWRMGRHEVHLLRVGVVGAHVGEV